MDKIQDLVVRLQQKDANAFQELHQRYAKNICGAIQVVVQDEAIAKEICQDVFVKVWQKSSMYDSSKGRFFTWLLNMARNAAIDFTRSKEFNTSKKNHSLDYFVHILEKPESEESNQDYSGLKKMISKLKKKCVQIIEMLYFRSYTQQETADEVGIPLGTVKSRNRNCLKALRAEIETNE